jgi:hypothetical protein
VTVHKVLVCWQFSEVDKFPLKATLIVLEQQAAGKVGWGTIIPIVRDIYVYTDQGLPHKGTIA